MEMISIYKVLRNNQNLLYSIIRRINVKWHINTNELSWQIKIVATLHFQVIKKRKIVMAVTGFYVTMQKTGQKASAIHCPIYNKIFTLQSLEGFFTITSLLLGNYINIC